MVGRRPLPVVARPPRRFLLLAGRAGRLQVAVCEPGGSELESGRPGVPALQVMWHAREIVARSPSWQSLRQPDDVYPAPIPASPFQAPRYPCYWPCVVARPGRPGSALGSQPGSCLVCALAESSSRWCLPPFPFLQQVFDRCPWRIVPTACRDQFLRRLLVWPIVCRLPAGAPRACQK